MAAGWYWIDRPAQSGHAPISAPANPLQLEVAAVFALLFVVVSIASSWAVRQYGAAGIYVLAAIVGVSDINPFVLTVAQNGAGAVSATVATIAILGATASNNLFQSIYALAYSSGKIGIAPLAALVILAAFGVGLAVALA